jgi:DNA polymerase I
MARGGARAHVNVDRRVKSPGDLSSQADAGLFAELETALFCVDGNNLLWRATHGNPAPFPANDGRDLTPIFRFFTLLRRALGTYGLFAECVVCFDGAEAWGERVDVDATYKANRRYKDKDLSFMGWLPEIRAGLEAYGVVNLELDEHEADDVIATLVAQSAGRPARILSTDRDYFQLISETTSVVNPRSRPAIVTTDDLISRYGVRPEQWCEFRALSGDPSDGIPGLRGVGPKRAAELLRDGRTLEDVMTDLDAGDRADVLRWRDLIRLRTDVEVHAPLDGKATATLPHAAAICHELGLA